MKRIQDRMTLGIVAGLLGSIPGRLINALEFRSGLTDRRYAQMSANLFTDTAKITTSPARAIGASANGILTCVTGVLTTYLLTNTGRDKAVLKGMGVGSLLWLAIYGLGSKNKLIKKSKKPTTPLLSLADHLIFGGLTGILVVALGEPNLFTDSKKQTGEPTPETPKADLRTEPEPTAKRPINQSARKITPLKDRVKKIEKVSFRKPRPLITKKIQTKK